MDYSVLDGYIDSKRNEIAETLSDLVKCNSLNPGDPGTGDEREVAAYLLSLLDEFGFEKDVVEVAENRPNVIGKLKGKGNGRDLIFNGHEDTVPIGDVSKWTVDPLGGLIKDGRVYGRGATDCKSGLTAALWAMRAVCDCGIELDGDVYYIASAGEESNEGGTLGLSAALADNYNDPFCIVCEASGLEIYPTSTGLFFFELTVYGKPCHVGRRNLAIYPQNYVAPCGSEVGVDALSKALPYIDYFYRLERNWSLRFRDRILGGGGYPNPDKRGVGVFTICPVSIQGGLYFGSMIDEIKMKYCVWYPEFADREKLIDEIKRGVESVTETDDWCRDNPPKLDIPVEQIWRGFKTDYDHPGIDSLKQSCEEVTGEPAVVTGFTAVADATYAAMKGIPVAICGAGSGKNRVHGFDEYAEIDELISAVKVYVRMILKWCKNR
jgi:acetylornithine deacetylase/succinyl-diaminopimelate desuccinylase-like protein